MAPRPGLLLAIILAITLLTLSNTALVCAQNDNKPSASTPTQQQKPGPEKSSPPLKAPSAAEELQQAIANAGNDRAALVRNLEAYLVKYPDSLQRPQIYRALVEANLQLRDTARAADYAERVVALAPEDMSITLVAIQLLQRRCWVLWNEPAWMRNRRKCRLANGRWQRCVTALPFCNCVGSYLCS